LDTETLSRGLRSLNLPVMLAFPAQLTSTSSPSRGQAVRLPNQRYAAARGGLPLLPLSVAACAARQRQRFLRVLRRAATSVAQAPRSILFDTAGRLQRGIPGQGTEPSERLFVPVHKGRSLVQPVSAGSKEFRPVLLTAQHLSECGSISTCEEVLKACLGTPTDGVLLDAASEALSSSSLKSPSFWLLDLSHLPDEPCPEQDLGLAKEAEAEWVPLRDRRMKSSLYDVLAADDFAALLAVARGMSIWHSSAQFCAKCGGKTVPHREGAQRRCTDCGTRSRPRIDPSVIVLVFSGHRCLLGRKAEWPEGRFSTLAGFVEFGESLEECLVREVQEESGVIVKRDSIRFVASQPWLFPRSLMVGFIAEAEETSITVDEEEMEAVEWFEASDVARSIQRNTADGFHVPSKASLARTLIEHWLREQGELLD